MLGYNRRVFVTVLDYIIPGFLIWEEILVSDGLMMMMVMYDGFGSFQLPFHTGELWWSL